MSARLEELRGLLHRMELGQLDQSDVPKLQAFLAEVIAETEADGKDGIDLELDLSGFERRD